MNTEHLRKKRQKNVQEQLALRKEEIVAAATMFREGKISSSITTWLESRGFTPRNAVLTQLAASPVCCDHTYEGLLVTAERKFFRFVVELSEREDHIEAVEVWEDVSHKIEVSSHKPGIGKTFGSLSLEVLDEFLEAGEPAFRQR